MSALADLLGVIATAPALPGARCIGLSESFDPAPPGTAPAAVTERTAAAVAICAQCVALEACRSWWEQLAPNDRPEGVVAGRVSTPGSKPRRKARPDLYEALAAALTAEPGRTDREHAREIECSTDTVAKARRALETAGRIDHVRRAPGRKPKTQRERAETA